MVFVEGGTYLIGDFYEQQNTDALPRHEVTVSAFYIGKYEITFQEYDQFAHQTGREFPGDGGNGRGRRAVVNITWDDAYDFCKSLGYRLPSEVEWEYAARSKGQEHLYSGGSNPDSLMFYAAINTSNINFSFPVGSFLPNELGLYDMSGNVFEWVDEFYQFYEKPELLHDHVNDGIRIIRGGSFSERRNTTRTYWRTGTLRDVKANDLGFRCVKSV
ncbi:MAG: formylglycine-generating enzyme family protein [Balneolales bacterium]|nr:formylglycine-generating enzyme family protein [Balneolales bacterium]